MGPRPGWRSSDGEVWENPLRAGEGETGTVGRIHGRAWFDGMQHVAKNRAFGVDIHAECLGRLTKKRRSILSWHHETGSFATPRSTNTRTYVWSCQGKMWCGTKPNFTKKQRSLKHWQPGDKWTEKITETLKDADLEDYTEWAEKVRDTAQGKRKDTKRSMDPTLMSLLAQLTTVFGTDGEERKKLSKRIWRRKRHPKREATEQIVPSAAADGRAPPGPKTEFAREMGQAAGRDGGLAGLKRRCTSQSRRGKSFGNHWLDQRGGRSAGGRHKWNRCHWFHRRTEEAQEGEEQSRRTDRRNSAESSPGAESI